MRLKQHLKLFSLRYPLSVFLTNTLTGIDIKQMSLLSTDFQLDDIASLIALLIFCDQHHQYISDMDTDPSLIAQVFKSCYFFGSTLGICSAYQYIHRTYTHFTAESVTDNTIISLRNRDLQIGIVKSEKEGSTIYDSNLRGRGGGGFRTGQKWRQVAGQKEDIKYIVCNGDEGDPGAFMDRSVMEGDPHKMLEGMLIAGYAVGAREGYIYVRAEYPLAVKRLKTAISQAEEAGLIGDDILGTGFSFRLHINKGAGAFVCGEGSALTASIEGERGMPRTKPPRTVEQGLFGKPTVLNNVETYRNIKIAVVHGLKNAADLLDDIKAGNAHYDFVEVMACRRGCILGGGQPVPMGPSTRSARMDGIYQVDRLSSIRYTDDNPMIERVWEDIIAGREHELLHRA